MKTDLGTLGGPITDLNATVSSGSGVHLTDALFINDGGEITATGFLSNGDQRAFVLVPCGQGGEGRAESAAGTATMQGNRATAVQRQSTLAPARPAPGERGMLGGVHVRRFPALRALSPERPVN